MFGTAVLLQASGVVQDLGLGDRPESVWLLIGTVLMLAGTFYFIRHGMAYADTKEKIEYHVVTIMITSIAFASYLAMFFGIGLTEVTLVNGEVLDIYWARYADWLFTTPLLLLDLALLAKATDRGTIAALVLVDAFMIVTGLAGALSPTALERYVWWTVSTIALLVLLYILWTNLTERAKELDEDSKSTFMVLRNAIVVLWLAYPVLWLFGTEGTGLLPLFHETLGFMILDVLAKVGFGLVLLRSRAVLGGSEEDAPEPSAEAAD